MSQSSNITWHDSEVTKSDRQQQNGHKKCSDMVYRIIRIWKINCISRT